MVECEYVIKQGIIIFIVVLIDTWWNVNYFFEINGIGGHAVLIDTWWNVNRDVVLSFENWEQRFNRYMVECE